jgi:hypothetical protein
MDVRTLSGSDRKVVSVIMPWTRVAVGGSHGRTRERSVGRHAESEAAPPSERPRRGIKKPMEEQVNGVGKPAHDDTDSTAEKGLEVGHPSLSRPPHPRPRGWA